MLAPNGTSDVALVKGDPALVSAASRVADGQLVSEPVAEGTRFAAVWRRGSLAAVKTTRADADAAIRELLQRDTLEKAARELVASLRAHAHVEVDRERLNTVVWDLPDFSVVRRTPAPGPSSSSEVHPDPVPRPGPGGLR
jgi:peptidyl-prolyl cis-trans isomerase C